MTKPRIGVLYKKRGNVLLQERYTSVTNAVDATEAEVAHHEAALAEVGYSTCRICWGPDFIRDVADARVDLIFNVSTLVEAAILEELAVPFIGSQTSAIAASLHKAVCKRLWLHMDLPTAPFHVAESEEDCVVFEHDPPFAYPLFLKPEAGRGSASIDHASVVENYQQLVREVVRRHESVAQPILIEPFLRGREITVGILGNGSTARVLPPLEIVLPQGILAAYFEVKQAMAYDSLLCPAPLTTSQTLMMQQVALQAYQALDFKDYGRFDMILTESGPFLLDANAFAGLMFDAQGNPSSYMSFMADAEGMRGEHLLNEIVQAALVRLGMDTKGNIGRS